MYTDPHHLQRLSTQHHRELLQAAEQARMVKAGEPSEPRLGRVRLGWLPRRVGAVTWRPARRAARSSEAI